jgi:hypothetical protein
MWLSTQHPSRRDPCRHLVSLGPVEVEMAAPRETVFDVIAEPYLGRTPRAMDAKLHVVDRGADLVVADHYTSIFADRLTVTTTETVGFERPHLVRFRLLRGPVASVEEEYRLDGTDGHTRLTYVGELGSRLPVAGGWWARTNARVWTSVVRASLADIRTEAERRTRLTPKPTA